MMINRAEINTDIKKLPNPRERLYTRLAVFAIGALFTLFLKEVTEDKRGFSEYKLETKAAIQANQHRCDSMIREMKMEVIAGHQEISKLRGIIDTLLINYGEGNRRVRGIIKKQKKILSQ